MGVLLTEASQHKTREIGDVAPGQCSVQCGECRREEGPMHKGNELRGASIPNSHTGSRVGRKGRGRGQLHMPPSNG